MMMMMMKVLIIIKKAFEPFQIFAVEIVDHSIFYCLFISFVKELSLSKCQNQNQKLFLEFSYSKILAICNRCSHILLSIYHYMMCLTGIYKSACCTLLFI